MKLDKIPANLRKSLDWRYILKGSLVDILFLSLFVFITNFLWLEVNARMMKIEQMMSQDPMSIAPQMNNMLTEVLSVLVVYAIILYVVIVLLQGWNWYLARKEKNFWRYLLRFGKIFGFYYLILVLVSYISLRISFASMFSKDTGWLLAAALAVVLYFMLISLSVKGNVVRKTLRIARKTDYVLLTYLVILVMFYLVDLVLKGIGMLGNFSLTGIIIVSAVFVLPTISVARRFLIKSFESFK